MLDLISKFGWARFHGYTIAARLEQMSSGALLLNIGTLPVCCRGPAVSTRAANPPPAPSVGMLGNA